MRLKARMAETANFNGTIEYSVHIDLPNRNFWLDSCFYKTKRGARQAANTLAKKLKIKLEWEE